MKISELIAELQKQLEIVGDVIVAKRYYDEFGFHSEEIEDVESKSNTEDFGDETIVMLF